MPEVIHRHTERDYWTASKLMGLPYIRDNATEGVALYAFNEPTHLVDNSMRRVIGHYLGVSSSEECDTGIPDLRREAMRAGRSV